MKKTIIFSMVVVFVFSIIYMGIGCKEPEVVVETVTETVTETVEVEAEEEESAAEKAGLGSELTVLSHRFPATEYYVNKMSEVEGVVVARTLMPHDKIMQIARINLMDPVGAYDILFTDDFQLREYAIQGYLEPLEGYIEEYNDEYELDQIPESLWNNASYDGHIYNIPFGTNIQELFYRPDILDIYGMDVPTTTDELLAAAKKLYEESNGEVLVGMTMKPGDGMINEFTSYLHAFGGEWYNKDLTPAFNSEAGLNALNFMIELYQYAPKESISWGNDEALIAVQNGDIAIINQWNTRAVQTDDPERSQIVGLMQYAPSVVVPGIDIPAVRMATWGYSIPANAPEDKDLIFNVLAQASNYDNQVGALDLTNPTRTVIGEMEAELLQQDKYRFLPAALENAASGAKGISYSPYFTLLSDDICVRLAQAVTGEITAEEALKQAEEGALDRLKQEGVVQ